ncbi:MAG TPA: hypothetical protein VF068_07860 [Rubrobacter sp.]
MIALSAVELTIVQPQNGAVFFEGETQVRMVGQVGELPAELVGVGLFYRWYSSLFPSQKDRYSINVNALGNPAAPFDAPLGVGSHVISLAASDQAAETESAQNATRHGGIAGGSQGEKQCVIHLFRATLVAPQPNAILNRANSTLDAEAPLQWGRKKAGAANVFEPNPDYHGINRIRFRWSFSPSPADGRAAKDFVPSVETLTFVPPGAMPLVRYAGPLPSGLGTGNYTLTLRVEDKNDQNVGHQTSRAVVLT